MVPINISDIKVEKIREKIKTDPLYKDLRLSHDSNVVDRLCDTYLHQDRDKALIKGTVLEMVAAGRIPEVPG